MPDVTKHVLSQSSLVSDVKAFFSIAQTRRTIVFAYGFTFTFVVFTIFIAFNPDISLSPWLRNTFTTKNSTSYQTQFSSFFSYFFSNYNSVAPQGKDLNNNTTLNVSSESSQGTNITGTNQSSLLNSTSSMLIRNGFVAEQRNGTMMGSAKLSLKNCHLFEGRWVKDDSYPLYPDGSCSPIDEKFNCVRNGRPDRDYQKLRWQPNGCNIPRLNATDMLEMLRGRRLAFVGDSLNRNMWESLVCILKSSVNNKSKVFEASGRHEFQTENSYSFVFEDYNCSVEFFWSPFLVQEWKISEPNGTTKETLRLDIIEQSASKYRDADIVVFNTGHWWTHEKTSQGKDYYQEGSHVYEELNVLEAFRRALTTWGGWVDANIHPNKSLVFFRGYSATHFSGGRWNSGGQCNSETEPIRNETYLDPYPDKMRVFETVMKGMKTPINYLNITRLTDYRKDGHPSVYRKKNQTQEERSSALRLQDCSHWCLPGVPDAWNELLYAMLLIQR